MYLSGCLSAAFVSAKKLVLRRKAGRNLGQILAKQIARGTIPSLEEFIANAHDADATHVNIEYDAERDRCVIEDDGTGMGDEGLEAFYDLGNSPKQKNRVTPKGRHCIGKFGIATILLESLANEYTLETCQKGKRRVTTEKFDKKGSLELGKIIPHKTLAAGNSRTGTTWDQAHRVS